MSYEGFVRLLCANGHQRVYDYYNQPEDGETCSCGSAFVYRRSVDHTNGYDPETDLPFEVAVAAKTCTCSCGNVHVTEETQFKIPQEPA